MNAECRGGAAVQGFTLIELALVIALVALLLAGLMVPLTTQIDLARYESTRRQLDTAKQALVAYAVANGNRLPCPDDGLPAPGGLPESDGLPDPPGGHESPGGGSPDACDELEGLLPYAVLGVPRLDAWGSPIRYRANAAFTQATGVPVPPLADTGSSFEVRTRGTPAGQLTLNDEGAPAAIVFSCGKNRIADADNNGNQGAAPFNCGAPSGAVNKVYIQDVFMEGEFDDVVDWLSTPALVARLMDAGTWPARGL